MDINTVNTKLFIIKFYLVDKVVFSPKLYTNYDIATSDGELLLECNENIIDFTIYEVKPYDV